jgi:hypothetical protein
MRPMLRWIAVAVMMFHAGIAAAEPLDPGPPDEPAPAVQPRPARAPAAAPSATPPRPRPRSYVIEEPRPREHDGFMLRGELGLARLRARDEARGTTVSGTGVAMSGAAGPVIHNLHVFLELTLTGVGNLTYDQGGRTTPGDGAMSQVTFGAGLGYYVMPADVLVSASLSFAGIVVDDRETGAEAGGGALALRVGKQWPVGRHLGIGITGYLALAGLTDDRGGAWSTTTLALLGSVTLD